MNSLRARLLVSLLAMLALVALAMGAISYRNVLAETEALFDYQLRQMALSLRDQGEIAADQAGALADEDLDFVIQVWTVDGRSIYASRRHSALPARAQLGFADIVVGNETWRTYGVVTSERVIQVAQPLQIRRRLAADAALRGVAPLLLALPLMLGLAGWLVARAFAPLRRVAAEMRARDAQALSPLPVAAMPDEVAPLVEALNALLARLARALDTQRAFVADAAHELRSPLTALKLQLQLVQRSPEGAARADATVALGAGIDRAARLVEQLLALARNEPGAAPPSFEALDLGAVVRAAAADTEHFTQVRGSVLEIEAPDVAPVRGDSAALHLLVRNLADNALRYSPAGARVELRVTVDEGRALLQVDDAGPGVPRAERARVFDRFVRLAPGDETGSGLGLAIVRGVAERHGAELSLGDSPLGGLRVSVRFPAVSGPAA